MPPRTACLVCCSCTPKAFCLLLPAAYSGLLLPLFVLKLLGSQQRLPRPRWVRGLKQRTAQGGKIFTSAGRAERKRVVKAGGTQPVQKQRRQLREADRPRMDRLPPNPRSTGARAQSAAPSALTPQRKTNIGPVWGGYVSTCFFFLAFLWTLWIKDNHFGNLLCTRAGPLRTQQNQQNREITSWVYLHKKQPQETTLVLLQHLPFWRSYEARADMNLFVFRVLGCGFFWLAQSVRRPLATQAFRLELLLFPKHTTQKRTAARLKDSFAEAESTCNTVATLKPCVNIRFIKIISIFKHTYMYVYFL